MLKFYYTSAGLNSNQRKAQLSLGGFKSNLPVDNGEFGAFFSDISMMSVKENAKKYLCLMLVNESEKIAYDVCLHFIYPENNFLNLQIAVVEPVNVSGEGYYVARVNNINEKPLYVEFTPADGVLNKVNIGDIEPGKMVGVWFESSLNLETIKNSEDLIYEQEGVDTYRYKEVELPTIESIKLNIDWEWERQLIERIPIITSAILNSNYIDLTFNYKMIDPTSFINDFSVRVDGVLKQIGSVILQNTPTNTVYRISMGENFTSGNIVFVNIKNGNISEDLPVEEGYKYRNLLAEVIDYEVTNSVVTTVVPSIKLMATDSVFRPLPDNGENFPGTSSVLFLSEVVNCGRNYVKVKVVFYNYGLMPSGVYIEFYAPLLFSISFCYENGAQKIIMDAKNGENSEITLVGCEIKDVSDDSVVDVVTEYQYIDWLDPYAENEIHMITSCESLLPNANPILATSNKILMILPNLLEP